MKMCIVLLTVIGSVNAVAQFRDQRPETRPSVSESFMRPSDGLLFGWLDPSRIRMQHSYSLSYSTFGGKGLSLGTYTNSLFYQFSSPLDVRFDISLVHSPFGSSAGMGDVSGLYLTRAELNYRPAENMLFQIQFRQLPAMYWWGSGIHSGLYDRMSRFLPEEDR